ncbi:hypothetical protein BH24ACI2_BH24ACI2_07290 [soil metagenome]|jgi:hypothetical protein|nr:hypothetical protein [Acidobacteriota bacterium]
MKSPTLNFLFGTLTAILLLVALNYCGFGIFDSPTTVKVISSVASPDGEFIAITNRASNKNGWCEERTNIHRKDEVFDWEREYVFGIDCGSEVELNWKEDRNLAITYSYNNLGVVRTSQEFLSKNKDVNISYFLKQ